MNSSYWEKGEINSKWWEFGKALMRKQLLNYALQAGKGVKKQMRDYYFKNLKSKLHAVFILGYNSVKFWLATFQSHSWKAGCISNPHEESFLLQFKVTSLVTVISHLSFNTAWLSSKFVYEAFIAKNPIKGVHTPHKCDQQHLETVAVPPLSC